VTSRPLPSDKRRETRRLGTGKVRVRFTDPQLLEIDGKLMDVSASGFRMKHDCTSLHCGQFVEFAHIEAIGRAQVIWNRILAGGVETGFLVVASSTGA
jgi:hypothetical protein